MRDKMCLCVQSQGLLGDNFSKLSYSNPLKLTDDACVNEINKNYAVGDIFVHINGDERQMNISE